MHRRSPHLLFLLILTALIAFAFSPLIALAEEGNLVAQDATDNTLQLVEGDIVYDFVQPGTPCVSSDPSIAWVDESGNLNALKVGTATITDNEQVEHTVIVSDYTDGTPVVGRLKILARYNDSMQFYDGHVYLLFTSYQDGVTVSVPDLYGAYEISDQYYADINEDIANGSNHTGTDTDRYFTFNDDLTAMTLNRGQIVTIGMYRDFDLSVFQAALGCLQNSTAWAKIVAGGKEGVVLSLFEFLNTGKITADEAFAKLMAVLDELGIDKTELVNGVVEGGVCFNRELYNQKLEYDQFENVTYELDITAKQLATMMAYLGGNLNNFSVLKNSCATVALRAWNGAIGTRNGEDTAYKLDATGEGIFSLMDAPKTVRDCIVKRLPGYYLNNSEGVAEPDASFQDDTGWVYVSAPEPVTPTTFVYDDESLVIDDTKSNLTSLVNIAKAQAAVAYSIEGQEIPVSIATEESDGATTITSVDFDINGTTVSLTKDSELEDGVWFKATVANPQEGESYYVTDAEGNALASEYADGSLSFGTSALPVTFKLVGSQEGTHNVLATSVVNGEKAQAQTDIYYKQGDEKVAIADTADLASGTTIYVKATVGEENLTYVPTSMTLNDVFFMDAEHYDAKEDAYATAMPESYATLTVTYETATVDASSENLVQAQVNDTLDVTDHAVLLIGGSEAPDGLEWDIIGSLDEDEPVVYADDTHTQLTANAPGSAIVWAHAKGNYNIGVPFGIEVVESFDSFYPVNFDDETAKSATITYTEEGDEYQQGIPYSGYRVPEGSTISIIPDKVAGSVISEVKQNGKPVKPGEVITVQGETTIKVGVREARIDMPSNIHLASQDDTKNLNAKVKYTGIIAQFLPVYYDSIRYESSDSLVQVSEDGTLSVTGEIPEGGKAVYVTAYAGASNDTVSARCRVTVGDYAGDKVVGKLTIWARSISSGELVAHGAVAFTTYDDLDLDASFYHYYKPSEEYTNLMYAYEDDPASFSSDPALYNNNELEIDDRESYLPQISHGAESPAETLHLRTGETITISNYSYDTNNLVTIARTLENATISSSENAQALLEQMKKYSAGEEIDGVTSFDSLIATLAEMYVYSNMTGHNPADGKSEGGLDINREIYNEFMRNDTQLPNNWISVEITADELAALEGYIADPSNNYYSLFDRNCGAGAVDIWNTILSDRPELAITANLTGLSIEPQSLYFALGAMRLKSIEGTTGGTDFYPRTLPSRHTWSITADGDTLTALCGKTNIEHYLGNCKNLTEGASVKVSATACTYEAVGLEGLDEFNSLTEKGVAASEDFIKFYRTDTEGATEGGSEVEVGTSEYGYYYVELTVDDQSARSAFMLTETSWQRYWGDTALDTAKAVVEADDGRVFEQGRGGAVLIATMDGYWDALAAAGLAGTLDAPVLITNKKSLSAQTMEEIVRLAPERALIMGGKGAVSDEVMAQVKALVPNTERVWGESATDTAVEIYRAGTGWSDTAIIATSSGYWDALSVAPYAWWGHAPIFLTDAKGKLGNAALAAIRDGGFKRAVIVGGTAAVSTTAESQVKGAGVSTVVRLAGDTALDTSAKIAAWEIGEGMGVSHMAVATSSGYWDALTGAAVCGKQASVLVLLGGDNAKDPYRAFDALADEGTVIHGHVLGGEAAVSPTAWEHVSAE
ncbi:MAG: cell wall-binding repeat-containing protein [Atopobiaceae bacterium]|nr:cell wall-binding repeat-containing protein [Atopobiaceae bacterium]